ncbi:MAG: DnaJ domain-containing protein [Campylobacteraceae bacterium]
MFTKIVGILLIILGVVLEIMWLGICFGSILLGVILLIFAPYILFLPFTYVSGAGFGLLLAQTNTNYQKTFYRKTNSYSNYNDYQSETKSESDILKYYEILESSPSDDFATIQKNYRRLIKEYHYDSLASKDLPKDVLEFAKEKTQKLNEAYKIVKTHKGF